MAVIRGAPRRFHPKVQVLVLGHSLLAGRGMRTAVKANRKFIRHHLMQGLVLQEEV